MANLPPIKRFLTDDFAGLTTIPAFAAKLFYPLNLFLNAVYSALNNGLTLNSNMAALVTSQSVTASSTGIATTTINWPFPQMPPVGVVILSTTLSSVAATQPQIAWSYGAGVIQITLQFTKITAGAVVQAGAGTYSVGFWATAG